MIITKINHPEHFLFHDLQTNDKYYGFDQEWYKKKWHRMAGCGPTTASHIVFYLQHTRQILGSPLQWQKKEDSRELMDVIWSYVTPTMHGVHKPGILEQGVIKFARERGVTLKTSNIVIEKQRTKRPSISEIARFIQTGLNQDIPIAFLNWHQGDCKNLESWHWVCVIGSYWDEKSQALEVDILDGGEQKRIDLSIWLPTTKSGGALVSFLLDDKQDTINDK